MPEHLSYVQGEPYENSSVFSKVVLSHLTSEHLDVENNIITYNSITDEGRQALAFRLATQRELHDAGWPREAVSALNAAARQRSLDWQVALHYITQPPEDGMGKIGDTE